MGCTLLSQPLCDSRKNYADEPQVEISGNMTVNMLIGWIGGKKMIALARSNYD
jgi:hypothetical protein